MCLVLSIWMPASDVHIEGLLAGVKLLANWTLIFRLPFTRKTVHYFHMLTYPALCKWHVTFRTYFHLVLLVFPLLVIDAINCCLKYLTALIAGIFVPLAFGERQYFSVNCLQMQAKVLESS